MTERPTSALLARPFLTALAVVAGALLLVAGLLLGTALTAPAGAAAPVEDSVDAGFARDMQVHHGQAVEMSVMVRDRSDDPQLRQIALDILLTQQNQQGQMAGWLQLWGLPQSSTQPIMGWMSGPFSEMTGMPGMARGSTGTGPDDEQPTGNPMVAMGLATDDQLQALRDADGVEAERIWLQLMIPHHRGGVQMAEVAQDQASESQVRRLAGSMVTAQTFEMTVLQDLLDARGGPVEL